MSNGKLNANPDYFVSIVHKAEILTLKPKSTEDINFKFISLILKKGIKQSKNVAFNIGLGRANMTTVGIAE